MKQTLFGKALLALLLCTAAVAEAQVRLAAPFADGMVLQRDRTVPVWGTARAGAEVTVSFAGQRAKARAAADGTWRVNLSPLATSRAPQELQVAGEDGTVTVRDVLVGEVWFASGQSNMGFTLVTDGPDHDRAGRLTAQITHLPHVRFASIRTQPSLQPVREIAPLVWKKFLPENLTPSWSVSAVAFYYVRELAHALDGVPIGLVVAAVGATCVDTWTPPCGFASRPDLADLQKWNYVARREDWPADRNKCPYNSWEQQPSLYWNGRLEAVVPFAMRGFIWYQGCHNANEPQRYASKMHALYNGWSAKFENPQMKCYFVQLPFWGRSDTHLIQEAQERFAAEEPNAGMAAIADLGNLRDIHPVEKELVGRRLALHALAKDYGFSNVVCEAPTLADWQTDGAKARLVFKNAKSFYVRNRDRSAETCFDLAGVDGVFKPARIVNVKMRRDARKGKDVPTGMIPGNAIELVAEGVADPRHVRYLYRAPWNAAVFSEVDLPLPPFHADATARTVRVEFVDPAKLRPTFVGQFAADMQAAMSVSNGALVVDAKRVIAKTKHKLVFCTPTIPAQYLFGKNAHFSLTASGPMGVLDVYFEGRTKSGRHYYKSRKVRLSPEPRVFHLIRELPEDLADLHLRVDILDGGDDKIVFSKLEWGLEDGSHYAKSPKCTRKAELIFSASMDGTAKADYARGRAEPVTANGLTFAPGIKGQAVRVTQAAKSVLAYAAKDNLSRREGALALWCKAEWPADDPMTAWRFLYSAGTPFGARRRPGSGATYLWYWGSGLRTDRSADRDGSSMFTPRKISGAWHHMVMCWDELAIRFYIDGRLCGTTGDGASPYRLATDDTPGFTFAHFEDGPVFFVGNESNMRQFDGLIDEFQLYSAPLTDREAKALYAKSAPEGHNRDEGAAYVTEGDAVPAGQVPYATLRRENPYLTDAPALKPGEIPESDLELVDRVVLDDRTDLSRLPTVGKLTVRELDGKKYLECDEAMNARFAVRFKVDVRNPLYVIDLVYPDDRQRTIDFVVQNDQSNGDYTMQCGVATGHEYANSNRFLTHRCLWWTRDENIAAIVMTARKGLPAAAREIRLWKVKSGRLPPVKVNEPPKKDGWNRTLALYFEDPAIGYDFGLRSSGHMPKDIAELVDRTAALMRFTGENVFAYPGSWYHGKISDVYNPRNHAPNFLSAFYEKFDREGLYVMPTMNQNTMPMPEDVTISQETFNNGSLHETVCAIHATGKPNPGGWHGTPPNFNISHPDVQKHILSEIDDFIAQGRAHPSFKGVCLHLTRHCMLWWGDADSGYNDYSIRAFRRACGVQVPSFDSDPLRGKAYAQWIRENAWEKWLDWRCDVVTALYAEIARRLRAARPDLRLWVNSQIMMNTPVDRISERDYTIRNDREAGLDAAKLNAAIPNLMLGETFEPADYRFRRRAQFKSDADYEAQHTQYGRVESWDLIRDAAYPLTGQHDRYFEDAIGREPGNLSTNGFRETGWRVSTINPSDFHALEHFVKPLRFQDVLGISKGGFLIGTYGMERHLAPFAAAFRALPAVRMTDVKGFADPTVRCRECTFEGSRYGYVVNTEAVPRQLDVPIPSGAVDLVTGQPIAGGRLALKPYELRAYVKN